MEKRQITLCLIVRGRDEGSLKRIGRSDANDRRTNGICTKIGSTASMTSTEPGKFSELPHSDHPQAAYLSGFQHGVIDGNSSSNVISYIDQPKHGFAWHSSEFVKGYVNGYCSIPANRDVGTDDDRAAFYCPDGPSSAFAGTSQLQRASL
jgi:hypothetical protein